MLIEQFKQVFYETKVKHNLFIENNSHKFRISSTSVQEGCVLSHKKHVALV